MHLSYLREMMETPPFYVTLVITIATIGLYQVDGQQFESIKPPCTCPGDVLKFLCSTVGPAFTTWKGSALQCPPQDNQIVLFHRQFNDTKECGSATARGISITGISNNYYTSQLNITFGDALNDTDIQCLYDNGTTQTLIGSDIIMSAGVLPPPDTIFVVNISSQKLIFHWNPVFPECQHVTYSITSSNCGDCLNTSSTSVTCSNFNVSTNATVCTLTVRSIVCANIVGDEATSVNVFLKVPISPSIIRWVPQYSNDSGTLTQITIQFRETDYFRISDGIDGTAQSYNITFCNESYCSFNIVDASVCVTEGSCTHEISVSTTFHYNIKTNVSVRVAAVNQFGTGSNSSPIIVDAANNIVEAKLDSDENIICSFMNQQVQNISCNITYWLCSDPKTTGEINAHGDIIDMSTNRISIPMAPNLLDGEYCFIIYAGYDNSSVRVKGTFEFTISKAGVVDYKIIFIGISTMCIAVLIILLMSSYVNKLKSKFSWSVKYSQLLHSCSSFIYNYWCRHEECEHCTRPKSDKNGVTNCTKCGFTYCTCKGKPVVTHSEDGRFKIILAEKDTSLSGIIEEKGLVYKRGRAYYEFVRDNEIISEGKEVILMEQDMKSLCSSPEAHLIIGVQAGKCEKPKLVRWPKVFIQSNGTGARFIRAGTIVLYDCKGLDGINANPPRGAVVIDSNQFEHFQVPDHEDQELDKFIQKKLKGNKYEIGRAYYEFVFNKEDIPEGREVILMDKKTEIMYTGKGVCEMIKAPGNDIEPPSDELRIQYRVFVQSRSPGNRHLRAGTLLLYKITEDSTNTPTDTEEQSFPHQVVVSDGDEHDMQEVTKYMDILPVTKDCELRKFIEDKHGRFERGLAYYQFVRETEDIYDDTNVVVMDQETRKLYIDPISKPIMIHRRGRDIERPDQEKYIIFVQSNTTGSRLLEAGTQVLYKRAKVD